MISELKKSKIKPKTKDKNMIELIDEENDNFEGKELKKKILEVESEVFIL
jgi:hypothetical protein